MQKPKPGAAKKTKNPPCPHHEPTATSNSGFLLMEGQEKGDLPCDPSIQDLPKAEGGGERLRKTT